MHREFSEEFKAVRQEFGAVRQEFTAVRQEIVAVRQEISAVVERVARLEGIIIGRLEVGNGLTQTGDD